MTQRRIALSALVLLGLLLVAGTFGVQRAWQQWRVENGIEQLDWQGLDIALSSLTVGHLALRRAQSGQTVDVDGRDLQLAWTWHWTGPQLNTVTLERLQLDVQRDAASTPATDAPPSPALFTQRPVWLPHAIRIEHMTANLPCAAGRCTLDGSLSVTRPGDGLPVDARLVLHHGEHRVDTRLSVDGRWPDALDLSADMAMDGEQTLTLQTRYQSRDEAGVTHWRGELAVPALPQTDWLLAWLKDWQPIDVDALPPRPDAGSLSAQWDLHAPATGNVVEQVSGDLRVTGHLPQPWPAPGFATVQGDAQVALTADRGQWLPKTVTADLQLSRLADWAKALPADLRPDSLSLNIKPSATDSDVDPQQPRLPLNVTLKARGAATLELTGPLTVATRAPWQVQIGQARLQIRSPELRRAGWTLTDPALDARITGQADTAGLTVSFGKSSSLKARRITPTASDSPLAVEGVTANLASQQWRVAYDLDDRTLKTFSIAGPAALAAQQIRHPQLKPQSWTFTGDLNANRQRLMTNGTLKAAAGAAMDLRLKAPFGGTLAVNGSAAIAGAAGAAAWAGTLTAWPDILSLSDGRIDLNAQLSRPANGRLTLHGDATFDNVGGTFNRTAWTGLSGPLTIDLSEGQLAADAPSVTIQTINPGIPIGPVSLDADYRGPVDQPGTGTLRLINAQASVLDGQVHVPPAKWPLDQRPIRIPLQVERISLARLMALYPTENLSGTGSLSGEIPVLIDDGVHVAKGQIRALSPGGRLQLPGERIQAFAQGNTAMAMVADAMKNFHYSVLDSTIDYARDGTLQLGLHIEGKNPDVHSGQPVVLNVNLEEDIPALLTSLQLSGRVNETVTERVKKLIRKRQETQDSKH